MADNLRLVVKLTPYGLPEFLQLILDRYSGEFGMKIIPREDLIKDQYPLVQGLFNYGFCLISTEYLDLFPNLRIISCCGSGVSHIDLNEATKRGIKVANTPNATSDSTADLAFALLLASARKVVQGAIMCKSPGFQKLNIDWYGSNVSGSTLGIVGLGHIGSAIIERAQGFKMNILYHSRTRKEHLEEQLGVQYCHTLKDLLKQADFVVLCTPLTPKTKNMISASEFESMKTSATIINISRGEVINQDDLVTALQTGQIHGAALDVTTPEPLPRDHPLLSFSNVIITPHIGTSTQKVREGMVIAAMDNLVAGLKGEPLLYSVN